MSDIAAVVRARLLSLPAVTAIVGGEVYVSQLNQSQALPAVLVERIGEVRSGHLRGGERMARTRVQVTSVASSRAQAVALDAAIDGDHAGSGLAYWRGVIGSPGVEVRLMEPAGVREGYDPYELRQYRVSRDYQVMHR